jgi:hypothetical protein
VSRRESPFDRFSRDERTLSYLTQEALREAFVLFRDRTVSRDRIVSIDSVAYELPREMGPSGRGGTKVRILHRLLEKTYHVLAPEGRLVRLQPVDLVANARAPRGHTEEEEEPLSVPVPTAADLAFERDVGCVLDEDGGVIEPPDDERNPP